MIVPGFRTVDDSRDKRQGKAVGRRVLHECQGILYNWHGTLQSGARSLKWVVVKVKGSSRP